LFALQIGYDVFKLNRPHWATLLGLVLFFLAMAAKLVLAQLESWAGFVAFAFA
jgi:hypothetical protein